MLVNLVPAQTSMSDHRVAPLRRVLKRLPEPALLIRNDKIVYVNGAARQLLGARMAALFGHSPLSLFHVDSIEEMRLRLRSPRPGHSAWQASEQKVVRADGSTRLVDAAVAMIVERDTTMQVLVMHDVTEKNGMWRGLLQSQTDLRRLAAGRDIAHEDERRSIARELHNELMQSLAAMRMELAAVTAQLSPHHEATRDLLVKVGEMALAAIDSTRRIVNQLKPPMIEELGLEPAIEMLLADFSRRSGTQCQFRVSGIGVERNDEAAASTCMYRVLEECVCTIFRNARTNRLEVRLEHLSDGSMVMTVRDDGASFSAERLDDPASVGLIGMQERLLALGGTLTMETAAPLSLLKAMIPRLIQLQPPGSPGAHPAATRRTARGSHPRLD